MAHHLPDFEMGHQVDFQIHYRYETTIDHDEMIYLNLYNTE